MFGVNAVEEVVMLPMSEMPLVTGGGKRSPANAIGIMNHFEGLGWVCFSPRLEGNFPDEGVGVDVIGLRVGRKKEKV
jgi:hypothetical protein